MGAGREAQGGGDICIHVADSHNCIAETNTNCKATTTEIKFLAID